MRRSTLGLVLVAVVAIPMGIGTVNNYLEQRERAAGAALQAKRQAGERAERAKEWGEAGAAITADLEKAIAESRGKDAKTAFDRYRDVANGALDGYAQPVQVAVAAEELKQIPKDRAIAREGALSELTRLDPDNPRWRRELAQAKREAEALRRREVEEQKRIERQTLAARRREGVSLGMTQERVLQSSWGRPETVNRSAYSFGTREQWVYGNGHYLYFENGILTSIQTRR